MIRIDNWENPEFLYALLIIPILIVWYWFKHKDNSAELRFSSMQAFGQIKPTLKTYFFHSLFILRILSIALIIIAMARPQSV